MPNIDFGAFLNCYLLPSKHTGTTFCSCMPLGQKCAQVTICFCLVSQPRKNNMWQVFRYLAHSHVGTFRIFSQATRGHDIAQISHHTYVTTRFGYV